MPTAARRSDPCRSRPAIQPMTGARVLVSAEIVCASRKLSDLFWSKASQWTSPNDSSRSRAMRWRDVSSSRDNRWYGAHLSQGLLQAGHDFRCGSLGRDREPRDHWQPPRQPDSRPARTNPPLSPISPPTCATNCLSSRPSMPASVQTPWRTARREISATGPAALIRLSFPFAPWPPAADWQYADGAEQRRKRHPCSADTLEVVPC